MKTSIKITISIAALLVVLVAIFFAAPYTDYKKAKAKNALYHRNPFSPIPDYSDLTATKKNYFQCCALWWKTKFQGETIDGGTLPEITVTAPKA